MAEGLISLGLMRGTAEDAVAAGAMTLFMPHGLGHGMGLDVHDCAKARSERYQCSLLEQGMVFTIEPGLYYRADDMLIP